MSTLPRCRVPDLIRDRLHLLVAVPGLRPGRIGTGGLP